MQQMLVETLRWTMNMVARFNVTFARDIDLPSMPSNQLAFSHTVTLPPLDIAELKGFIRESVDNVGGLVSSDAKVRGVQPRPIPGMSLLCKRASLSTDTGSKPTGSPARSEIKEKSFSHCPRLTLILSCYSS
jgi:hypothetical protein